MSIATNEDGISPLYDSVPDDPGPTPGTLGAKAVGSVVKIKIDGVLRDFIVVQQGRPSSIYDASCDGTWLLMKECYEARPFDRRGTSSDGGYTGRSSYSESGIHQYLNETFLNLIDSSVRNKIKQVKIPYKIGGGGSGDETVAIGENGLLCKIFLISMVEGGIADSEAAVPPDGSKLTYFESGTGTSANEKRAVTLPSGITRWYTRSPYCDLNWGGRAVLAFDASGVKSSQTCPADGGIRPACVFPSTLRVSTSGTLNTAPNTPSSITIPGTINGGSTITISWTAATDTDNNLEGYFVERSTDGGSSWTQIYQGNSLSITNTVPFGTASVMYRVKAYDAEGLQSGYRTSAQVTVVNNRAPGAPASITVPNEILGGGTVTVTWGAASDSDGNLSGYALERQIDGGNWSEIHRGNALSFTDSITKGWASVAYRVRAYDALNAYGSYTTSPTRNVNNNTAPVIACSVQNGGNLGVKTDGFSVTYLVDDVDADSVNVTEYIDGVQVRQFAAVLEGENSFSVTGDTFMRLLNGAHTLKITADDGQTSTVYTLSFTKSVTSASITLEEPMSADAPITICVLSVIGGIPADAQYTVEVTNNALDASPVWEDCTAAVKTGANHIFTNTAAVSGYAFNFRVTVSRGQSNQGGFITSVQGGFQ